MEFDDAFESATLCGTSMSHPTNLTAGDVSASRRSTMQTHNMSWLQNPSWCSAPTERDVIGALDCDPFGASLRSVSAEAPATDVSAVRAAVEQYMKDDGTHDDVTSSFFLMRFAAERDIDPQLLLSSCSRFRNDDSSVADVKYMSRSGQQQLPQQHQPHQSNVRLVEATDACGYEAGSE